MVEGSVTTAETRCAGDGEVNETQRIGDCRFEITAKGQTRCDRRRQRASRSVCRIGVNPFRWNAKDMI